MSRHVIDRSELPLVDLFWSLVHRKRDDDCWLWQGQLTDKGYGHLRVCGKQISAHRLSFELTRRRIPGGQWVLHRCDNPPCVNPAHLFLGTNLDNVRDRGLKGRHHPGCKLTLEVAREIRESPLSARLAAEKYGVAKSTVCKVRRGDHWTAQELGQ